jgi:putative ABC transport system permease protein
MRKLSRLEGVKLVMPSLTDLLGEMGTVNMGVPELVIGVEPEHLPLYLVSVGLEKGRWLERGDRYHAVVGASVARKHELDLGKTVEWREEQLTVVGILVETKTTPDQFVCVPLDVARKVQRLPSDTIGSLTVVPEDPGQVEQLALRINQELAKVKAKSPKEAIDEIRQGLATFQVIMLSGAVLAAVVGGLSVSNTMIMSVHERTREIGVKKAVGATTFDILREYVGEAALIGVSGGVVGVGLGWLTTILLNATVASSLGGSDIWLVTSRLVVGALFFATALGAGAGLYPAWRGATLEPIEALRSE